MIDSILTNYGVNAVQAASYATSPSSAGMTLGTTAASSGLSTLNSIGGISAVSGISSSFLSSGSTNSLLTAITGSGVPGLNSLPSTSALTAQLNNFSLTSLTTQPVSIDASTFLSKLKPSVPSIAGSISTGSSSTLNGLVPTSLTNVIGTASANPLSVLNMALNANPVTTAVAGTTSRASITAQLQSIINNPKDPNASKLQVPSFAVPSAADISAMAMSNLTASAASLLNQLQSQANTVQNSLNVTSINSTATAALGSLKSITGSLSTNIVPKTPISI